MKQVEFGGHSSVPNSKMYVFIALRCKAYKRNCFLINLSKRRRWLGLRLRLKFFPSSRLCGCRCFSASSFWTSWRIYNAPSRRPILNNRRKWRNFCTRKKSRRPEKDRDRGYFAAFVDAHRGDYWVMFSSVELYPPGPMGEQNAHNQLYTLTASLIHLFEFRMHI